MLKKPSLRSLKNKADDLFSEVGRENARCEVCETLPLKERINYKFLNAHHIVGKRNKTLRWNLRNRCWLCPSHHTLGNPNAHDNGLWFAEWMEKYRPKDKEYLRVKRNVLSHYKIVDMQKIIEDLERKLRKRNEKSK